MDTEWWRWVWLAVAAVFGIGEIFTAGFFLLPFSAGALVAFVLAWFEIEPTLVHDRLPGRLDHDPGDHPAPGAQG